jgi:parallel beta-helix repeat protein
MLRAPPSSAAILPLLLLVPAPLAAAAGAAPAPSAPESAPHLAGPHAPILIVGNSGFNAANGVTGGSGTPQDPYRIEGWDIARNATAGIEVRNTTAHFEILDVTIIGSSRSRDAMRLDNVRNASLRNVFAREHDSSLFVSGSYDVAVFNLTSNATETSGIHSSGGGRLRVENSSFEDSGQAGVWVEETDAAAVLNSTLLMRAERGAMFERASGFEVLGSRFEGGRVGVEPVDTGGGRIAGNRFANISGDGVFIRTGDANVIEENVNENLTIGIIAGNSRANIIRNNTFDRCLTAGITLQQVTRSVIDGNTMTNTTLHALQLISSPNNTIRGNTISNAGYGFDLQMSSGDTEAYLQDVEPTNTVDGRPLVYLRNASGPAIPLNASYLALVNVSGASVSGLDISRQGQGAVIVRSSNITIRDSRFSSLKDGILVNASADVALTNITFDAAGQTALTATGSARVLMGDSIVRGSSSRGAYVKHSDDVTFSRDHFEDNTQTSIFAGYSRRLAVLDTRFIQKAEVALELDSTVDTRIERNYVRGGITAFQVDAADRTRIIGNVVEDVLGDGIYPRTSNRNTILDNRVRRVPHPLDISLSYHNDVRNNTLEDVDVGIFLTFVYASNIENNTARNVTFQGMLLERSPLLRLRNNTVENATYGADIRSDPRLVQSYWLDVDRSNSINGKPLVYIANATSPAVPKDAGFVALVNVTGEVSGLELGKVSEGVLIAHSRDLVFRDSRFDRTEYGAFVHASDNVTVRNVTSVRGLQAGVWLQDSRNVALEKLNVTDSVYGGVVMVGSTRSVLRDSSITGTSPRGDAVRMELQSIDNEVTRNTIADNAGIGVKMDIQTWRNRVHRNDIVRNNVSAIDKPGTNHWNSSSHGNYYSDYLGWDANCDGIGERFYLLGAGARDFRPLVKRFAAVVGPCAPLELRATAEGSSVMLKWKPPGWDGDSAITGYRIYRGSDEKNLTEVASIPGARTYTDSGLEPNVTYYYGVRAVNSAGPGNASGVAVARTWWVPPPRADLAVERVGTEPALPVAGDEVRVRARVRNVGGLHASGGEVEISVAIDGGAAQPVIKSTAPASGLLPQESFDVIAQVSVREGFYEMIARLTARAAGEVNGQNDVAEASFFAGPAAGTPGGAGIEERTRWDPSPLGASAGVLLLALLTVLAVAGRDALARLLRPPKRQPPPRRSIEGRDNPPAKPERRPNQVKSAAKSPAMKKKKEVKGKVGP